MYLLSTLFTIVTCLSLSFAAAEARVAYLRLGQPIKTVPHDISIYTQQFFLEHALYEKLPCNSCLFYTYSLTAVAQRYARGSKLELITIWDIWPSGLYNGNTTDESNALRKIFSNPTHTRKYYENMSAAMARLCGGSATVMTTNVRSIPADGIWGMSELPTLKRGGRDGNRVHTVVAIDAKGDNPKTVWEHPDQDLENCEAWKGDLKKRQGRERYLPEQLQDWFGKVPF